MHKLRKLGDLPEFVIAEALPGGDDAEDEAGNLVSSMKESGAVWHIRKTRPTSDIVSPNVHRAEESDNLCIFCDKVGDRKKNKIRFNT